MFDLVKLTLQAGDGGNGKVSFRREKFITKGGPDGGHGGDGGNIYVRGSKHFNTLQHYAGVKEFKAQKGQDGGSQKSIGSKSDDVILEVPIGTTIWLLAENKISENRRFHVEREGRGKAIVYFDKYYLDRPSGAPPAREEDELHVVREAESESGVETHSKIDENIEDAILHSDSLKNIRLTEVHKVKIGEVMEDGQMVLVCASGQGGRGNDSFKGSTNTTPFEAEYGTFGEKKVVLFELRLLADVGLVGYPNAGKSTFLSIVTKANPKIANYPFTTLEPNLGVMSLAEVTMGKGATDIVLADIPGLIEGASEGKGLGFDFLRHVQACKVLLFLLSLEETTIFDESLSEKEKAQDLFNQFTILRKELISYDQELEKKPFLISISKADLYPEELISEVTKLFKQHASEVLFFSSITQVGVHELKQKLVEATA